MSKTIQFPEVIHRDLLNIAFQQQSLEKQKNTIVGTFFATMGIENPADYIINLEDNTITLKPKQKQQRRGRKKPTTANEKE